MLLDYFVIFYLFSTFISFYSSVSHSGTHSEFAERTTSTQNSSFAVHLFRIVVFQFRQPSKVRLAAEHYSLGCYLDFQRFLAYRRVSNTLRPSTSEIYTPIRARFYKQMSTCANRSDRKRGELRAAQVDARRTSAGTRARAASCRLLCILL